MYNTSIYVVLSEELKEKVQKLAKRKNISQNALVRIALSEYLEKQEREDEEKEKNRYEYGKESIFKRVRGI